MPSLSHLLDSLEIGTVFLVPSFNGHAPTDAWLPGTASLQIVLAGSIPTTALATGESATLGPGDMLFCAPGAASIREACQRQHLAIHRIPTGLDVSLFTRAEQDPPGTAKREHWIPPPLPEATALIDLISNGMQRGAPRAALHHLARGLIGLLACDPRPEQPADLLLTWLRAHCHEDLDRRHVALAFDWHPDHLTRVCRAAGLGGFNALLNRLRCERAQQLLLNHDSGLDEIATRCGYAGAGYFIRRFKRQHGLTPDLWRKQASPPG